VCELAVGYRDTTLHVSVFIIIMVYTHADVLSNTRTAAALL